MSSPRSVHPSPVYASASARPHPYAPPRHAHHRRRSPGPRTPEEILPPSPPHSRRDGESPSMAKQPAPAIDRNDNYWDDVPAPPASLKSILDSFRASGEGDRDLLMAILGAKKAEEERLTSIIQTRLTVLQARLNLASIQAQLAAPVPSPTDLAHHERTPSLSHSSASSSINSPPLPHMQMHPHPHYFQHAHHDRSDRVLPPPSAMGYDRLPPLHRERSDSGSSRRPEGLEMLLEGVREAEARKERV